MRELGSGDIFYIIGAVRWTLLLSVIAFIGGSIGGALVALARTGEFRWLRMLAAGYIKVFQGTPLLMQLFLAFFAPGIFGVSVDPWTAAAIGLSLHASAFLGEIWRGAIEAVGRGQWEGSTALGLSWGQSMRYVVVPRALKVAIPPTVGFSVQVVKNTALASIVGFIELTRAGQIVSSATFQPLQVYLTVAAIYFMICSVLSYLSRFADRRINANAA